MSINSLKLDQVLDKIQDLYVSSLSVCINDHSTESSLLSVNSLLMFLLNANTMFSIAYSYSKKTLVYGPTWTGVDQIILILQYKIRI